MLNNPFKLTAVSALFLTLAACSGGSDDPAPVTQNPPPPAGPVACGAAVAGPAAALGDTLVLTSCGKLTSFNKAAPQTQVGTVSVTGLTAGETLIGIDYRPATNQLYGVTKNALYVINPTTGVASGRVALSAALTGTNFGVDVNPSVDALRVVSDNDGSFAINFTTGVSTAATATVTPAAASVTASAYTNSFAGTGATRLFSIDTAGSNLYVQNAADSVLSAPIALGVTAIGSGGFDIDGSNNVGYAALKVGTTTSLYRINLAATAAPAATVVTGGAINVNGEDVVGLTLVPAAGTVATTGVVGLLYAVSSASPNANTLVTFDAATPNTTTAITVTGLTGTDTIRGIDFRPADGTLWAFAMNDANSAGALYQITLPTGTGTTATAGAPIPVAGATYDGSNTFSVDFNPVANALRVVGFLGMNLRITVPGGVATQEAAYAALGNATAVAYTNNFAAPAGVTNTTRLIALNQNDETLNTVADPAAAVLSAPLPLTISVADVQSMDIKGGDNGLALAALSTASGGPHSLYQLNLTTGAATAYKGQTVVTSVIGGTVAPRNLADIAIRR